MALTVRKFRTLSHSPKGFLMRRSFELAFATAYLFGGDKPRFLEVDDISFDKPVDVGDLLVFKVRKSA